MARRLGKSVLSKRQTQDDERNLNGSFAFLDRDEDFGELFPAQLHLRIRFFRDSFPFSLVDQSGKIDLHVPNRAADRGFQTFRTHLERNGARSGETKTSSSSFFLRISFSNKNKHWSLLEDRISLWYLRWSWAPTAQSILNSQLLPCPSAPRWPLVWLLEQQPASSPFRSQSLPVIDWTSRIIHNRSSSI